MKRFFHRIFAAAVALAMLFPVSASGQPIPRAGGDKVASQINELTSKPLPGKLLTAPGVGSPTLRSTTPNVNSYIQEQTTMIRPKSTAPKASKRKVVARAGDNTNSPTIVGGLIHSDLSGQSTGVYQLPLSEDEDVTLLKSGINATYGGVIKDGVYYATNYSSFWGMVFIDVYAYNVETWERIWNFSPSTYDYILWGAAYDQTTDRIYAIAFNPDGVGLQLVTIDYGEKTATINHIAEFNYYVNSLVCDSQGQLYAILNNKENNVVLASFLCKVNKTNGEVQQIGVLDELASYDTGAVIDPKTDTMYWTLSTKDENSFMCEVDLQTAEITFLYQFPNNEQFRGVQIVPPEADNNAPAAPEDLSLDFAEGSLTGNVNFTVPAKHFDGSDASGAVSYRILANGTIVANGQSSFGAEESVVVSLDTPGMYEFVITASNESGTSPKARVSGFIGNGIPEAPQPKAEYADGTMTLTWDAITTSSDGGYIDVNAMTYTIKDKNTDEVLAEGVTDTTWSYELASPDELIVMTYSVTAVCNGISSAAGETNAVLGYVTPPYENNFEQESDLLPFTILDSNEDGETWYWYDYTPIWPPGAQSFKCARVRFHRDHDTDDWLISPPMKLEGGVAYYLTLDAKGESSNASEQEKMEISYGKAATVEGMTSVILPPTMVEYAEFHEYGGYIVPEEDGIYYVGIHGMSAAYYTYGLSIDNFKVEKVGGTASPTAPSDVVITPGAYGALNATIAFNAPTKTIGGEDLTEISKIEIARDGLVFETLTDIAPGQAVSVGDVVDTFGTYTYTIIASNEEGPGEAYTETVYIGVPEPANVSSVSASVDGNELTVSWEPVTTDKYGKPVYAEQVKYFIMDPDGTIIADNIEGTSWNWTFTGDKQEFVQFGVGAVTEGGRSEGVLGTNLTAMGPAYVDFFCSFPDASFGDYVFYTLSNGGQWMRCSLDGANGSTQMTSVQPYDGDNGCIAMEGRQVDNTSLLVTGVISLENTENPGVSFYTYAINDDDENELEIYVTAPNTRDFVLLKKVVVKNTGEAGWNKVMASLDGYAGQKVQIGIRATTKSYTYTFVDAIKVGSMVNNDLAAKAISAPAKVTAGDEYSVLVNVVNEGFNNAQNYKVELYADGDLVDTKECGALASQTFAKTEFVRSFTPFDTESVIYSAKVIYAGDEDEENNMTDEIVVEPEKSKLPSVLSVKGEATKDGNVLTWTEPNIAGALPDPITEDFESAGGFQMDFNDWIFVDVDQAKIGGFLGLTLPGIPTNEGPASWFVFDASGDTFTYYGGAFAAASGSKYLACLYRSDLGTVDDWAISPELLGRAQTISFKARCYDSSYSESLEVWYSTGSTDVNDFVRVPNGTISLRTIAWTEYSFDLPEGAKRFALRCHSTNAYMLMLDDVKFIPAGAEINWSLVGYDIYRDGVKINNEVVTERLFTDTDVEWNTSVTYNVVAVYTIGMSAPSAGCTVSTVGIDAVYGEIEISKAKGEIIVTGADGAPVQVVAVDGKIVYSGVGEGRTVIPVETGVYVVKAGNKQAKLLVD